MEKMRAELVDGRLPPELATLLPQALYRPDRNRFEIKALEAACVDTGLSAARLLLRCGAIRSSHDYHFNRFLFEHFPEGADFPALVLPSPPQDLPVAKVAAFSIDDADTTEIDDAFSVTPRADGGWRVGIHIAAPALGFARGSALETLARRRLSTVYMPGNKITMLPDDIVDVFTLIAGRECPAVSLYLDVNADFSIAAQESQVERVPVAANLRLHELEPILTEEALAGGGPDFPWKKELSLLWELANISEATRGKPATNQTRLDYAFSVDWSVETDDGPGEVTITPRKRGAPVDKLVSELMILANSTWGKQLAKAGIPGLYRVQGAGKVRMSTVAASHEGLGVDCYAWSSSPLRRYVDLVNQWQIVAMLTGQTPPFAPKSADLMVAMRDFELAYAAYAEFQRQMERYWCLRWLRRRQPKTLEAVVVHDNLVRLEMLPLMFRVPALPIQLPGSRISVEIKGSDLLDVELDTRFVATLKTPDDATLEEISLEGS